MTPPPSSQPSVYKATNNGLAQLNCKSERVRPSALCAYVHRYAQCPYFISPDGYTVIYLLRALLIHFAIYSY